jgi:squalene synthase HpnC
MSLELLPNYTLAGGPPEYLTPAVRPTLAEAQLWCRTLATTHYENFHVATWFLPKRIRPYFESIYAFSRVADDLGDEVADTAVASALLTTFDSMLDECYDHPERSRHPVFVALQQTIAETQVPRQLFADLIHAFQMDQTVTRYDSLDQLIGYSRYSANPVGRLVLWVSGYRDEPRAQLSDQVCTALQLINFWQDVVEDWERGRRYLPADLMAQFGVTDDEIIARRFTPQFRAFMQHLVTYTRAMLHEGSAISKHVDRELATTLDLFRKGGESILDAIAAQDFNTLKSRPEVSKSRKMQLLAGAVWGKLFGARS